MSHAIHLPVSLTAEESRDIERIRNLGRYTTVLLILFRLDRPVTISDVARLANLTRDTARAHLRALSGRNLVARSRPGWILTAGGRQLILPDVAKNSPPLLSSSSSSSSSFKNFNVTNTCIRAEEEEKGWRNSPPPLTKNSSDKRSKNPPAGILEAYREAGIGLNARTRRLAAQEWITPEYIRAHRRVLVERGKGQAIGLLITILESGEPAPEAPEDLGDGRRYITGKYAEFIEH